MLTGSKQVVELMSTRKKALEQAQKAFNEAMTQAEKTHSEAVAQAMKAYEKIYNETLAQAEKLEVSEERRGFTLGLGAVYPPGEAVWLTLTGLQSWMSGAPTKHVLAVWESGRREEAEG